MVVSLVVQKFTRACMVSTVVEEHGGCMPRLKPLLENVCSMDVIPRSVGNFYVFFFVSNFALYIQGHGLELFCVGKYLVRG